MRAAMTYLMVGVVNFCIAILLILMEEVFKTFVLKLQF